MDCERVRRLIVRAETRYRRRRAATVWWWHWCRKRWNRQPHCSTKVSIDIARTVRELRRSPRRHGHISYEDCLALEDEASMLVNRLLVQQKRGGEVDITQSEST